MIDWIRERLKPATEKQQERVSAYVDGELSPTAQAAFEAEMANDEALRQEVAMLRQVSAALQSLPAQPVPRNYTLDPAALRTVNQISPTATRAYPIVRAAAVLTVALFIFAASLSALNLSVNRGAEPMADTIAAAPAAQPTPAAEAEMAVEPMEMAVEEADVDITTEAEAMAEMAVEAVTDDAVVEEALALPAAPTAEEGYPAASAALPAAESAYPAEELPQEEAARSLAPDAYPAQALPPADADTAEAYAAEPIAPSGINGDDEKPANDIGQEDDQPLPPESRVNRTLPLRTLLPIMFGVAGVLLVSVALALRAYLRRY